MKPAWDQLMEEFKDSKTAVVADVDCTVEEELCSTHGVQGYPTIKYGNPDALEDYNGGRDFDDLKKFASENLGPSCGPDQLDLCSEEQKKEIAEIQALSADEVAAKIKAGEKAIEDADAHFTAEVEKLQATYEKLSEDKDAAIKEAKKPLGILKMVQKASKDKKEL
jgi:protein disulfide-isomerase A6